MSTYRLELEKMIPKAEGDQINISNFTAKMYRFLSWLVKISNRQEGYINFMATNKDPNNAIDILQVVYNCIDDNECCLTLSAENIIKIDKMKQTIYLILNNLDHSVRTDRHIIYDDEKDDENPLLDCDMLTAVFDYADFFIELAH